MKIEIISNEKHVLEFAASGCEVSIFHFLVEKLNAENDVEFAAYKTGHPILGSPTIIVKTKKGNALKLVTEQLEALGEQIAACRKEFKNATK